jgi:hypothetical protein
LKSNSWSLITNNPNVAILGKTLKYANPEDFDYDFSKTNRTRQIFKSQFISNLLTNLLMLYTIFLAVSINLNCICSKVDLPISF